MYKASITIDTPYKDIEASCPTQLAPRAQENKNYN